MLITALAEQVTDWWTRRHKKGLLIHAETDGNLEIKELDIPYGQVIFVGADGKVAQYWNVSGDQLKAILDAASKGVAPPAASESPAGKAG